MKQKCKCGHEKKDHDYSMDNLCSLHDGKDWCKCKKFKAISTDISTDISTNKKPIVNDGKQLLMKSQKVCGGFYHGIKGKTCPKCKPIGSSTYIKNHSPSVKEDKTPEDSLTPVVVSSGANNQQDSLSLVKNTEYHGNLGDGGSNPSLADADTLSDKRCFAKNIHDLYHYEEFDGSCPNQIAIYPEENVREFIKKLKDRLNKRMMLLEQEKAQSRRKDSGTFQYQRNMKITLLKEILSEINKVFGEELTK